MHLFPGSSTKNDDTHTETKAYFRTVAYEGASAGLHSWSTYFKDLDLRSLTAPGQVLELSSAGSYEDHIGQSRTYEQNVPDTWWVRHCRYKGITLQKALEFNDAKFARYFLHSMTQIARETDDFFYLQWQVCKKDLDVVRDIEWKIVVTDQGYGFSHWEHAGIPFADLLSPSSDPVAFTHDEILNFILVAPGKHGVQGEEKLKYASDGAFRNVHKFMSEASEEEKFELWHLVGNMALAWFDCQVDEMNNSYPDIDKSFISRVPHLDINTHGTGVPWFHVRLEEIPEYDAINGKVLEKHKNPNVRYAPKPPAPRVCTHENPCFVM